MATCRSNIMELAAEFLGSRDRQSKGKPVHIENNVSYSIGQSYDGLSRIRRSVGFKRLSNDDVDVEVAFTPPVVAVEAKIDNL